MAQVELRIAVRKRWFFWPAFFALMGLHRIGAVKDLVRASAWLVEHGIRWETA